MTNILSSPQGRLTTLAAAALSTLLLSACGSSSNDTPDFSSSSSSSVPSGIGGILNQDNTGGISGAEWPELNVRSDQPKLIQFSWSEVEGADHYRLFKNTDGSSGFEQVGDNLSEPAAEDRIAVHQHHWHDARYLVEACMDAECSERESSEEQITTSVMLDTIGYFKASNAEENDWFGWNLALSDDGQTLAVGAPREASQARGVNGDQQDNSVFGAGAVYVFTLEDGQWQHQAYLKASNTAAPATNDDGDDITAYNDRFGLSLSLSADGNRLAVGAPGENSDGLGVDPDDQDNNRAPHTGAVYLFQRSEDDWQQTAFVKASNATPAEDEDDEAQDADEETAEENPEDEEEPEIPTNLGDRFGERVTLSGDGLTLAVSSLYEASAATGIDGDESDNSRRGIGAVYVFSQGDDGWAQQTYVKPSHTAGTMLFGSSLALSTDGNTLAVGAPQEQRSGQGVDPDESPYNLDGVGAVFVFERNDQSWNQSAYIKPIHTIPGLTNNLVGLGVGPLEFGTSVSLSGDGNRLAVGQPRDLNASTGPEANPDDYDFNDPQTVALNSGAVYVFDRSGGQWSDQAAFLKPSNTHGGMRFGRSLALSAEGNSLVVSAWHETSAETGINGAGDDRSMPRAGSAYLFSLNGGNWTQSAYLKAPTTRAYHGVGASLGLSAEGKTLAVGAHRDPSSATDINADRTDESAPDSGAVFLY